ncbi:MAG: HPr family phosphocarrier protein [Alphaproteobacteria bacterium]|nr:MAG: HPr family phosphocarrier protein [Alphaproteobacteria bacterium]
MKDRAALVRRMRIVNEKGLHARASARFVEVVEAHDARVRVRHDGIEAAGDSIMGLLMLGAAKGAEIEVEAEGPQAASALEALEKLVSERFGEDF